MHSSWKLFTNAETSQKALKLLARVQERMDCELLDIRTEPHHDGGHVVSFVLPHEQNHWDDVVVEVLARAQKVGNSWLLLAHVEEEIDIMSNNTCVGGVNAIHCHCLREPTNGNH